MESPKVWYAMQATYKRNLNFSELLQGMGVDYYIPLKAEQPNKKGMSRDPLLIFIHSTQKFIDLLTKEIIFLRPQFIYESPGKRKPVTMSEVEMKRFVKENRAEYKASVKAAKAVKAAKKGQVAGVGAR